MFDRSLTVASRPKPPAGTHFAGRKNHDISRLQVSDCFELPVLFRTVCDEESVHEAGNDGPKYLAPAVILSVTNEPRLGRNAIHLPPVMLRTCSAYLIDLYRGGSPRHSKHSSPDL